MNTFWVPFTVEGAMPPWDLEKGYQFSRDHLLDAADGLNYFAVPDIGAGWIPGEDLFTPARPMTS